jgi:hypothetical protein
MEPSHSSNGRRFLLMSAVLGIFFGIANLGILYVEFNPPPVPILISTPGSLFVGANTFSWGPYNFTSTYTVTGQFSSNAPASFSLYLQSEWNSTCGCPLTKPSATTGTMNKGDIDFTLTKGIYYVAIKSDNPNATLNFPSGIIARPMSSSS